MPVAISAAAAAVEIDFQPDIGFRRFALDGGRARHDDCYDLLSVQIGHWI